jgi:F-type H+-transporting ATPase subunit c
MKKAMTVMMLVSMMMLMGGAAFAADGAAPTFSSYAFAGAGIGIAIAALGGALGQGRTAASALEGISRNPGAADKMFVPMILGLVLIESLVIYALVIEILILFHGKIKV